jgi:hypothetical protein
MKDFHFFAASVFDWGITTEERDLSALIKLMTDFGHDFNVWLVPCSSAKQYEINWFAPQVEGAVVVGEFPVTKKSRAKVKAKWKPAPLLPELFAGK